LRYLLGTNVVSELIKTPGNPAAIAWVSRHEQAELFLSVVTLMQLHSGIQALPLGNRRLTLDRWSTEDLPLRFANHIFVLDVQTADVCDRLLGERKLEATIRKIKDFWLAATALQHKLAIVTRNERDFRDLGVDVINPWMS
jgi:predicted nucleic acid-binding protein